MPKRFKIITGVILAVVVGWIGLRALWPSDPVYAGKPLMFWLNQYKATHRWQTNGFSNQGGAMGKQAETAISEIGAKAIPICLRLISAKESPLKLELLRGLPTQWGTVFLDKDDRERGEAHQLGCLGLAALGAEARPAVPALITLLNSETGAVRFAAFQSLGALSPAAGDALPVLRTHLKDPSPEVQFGAVLALELVRQSPDRVVPVLVDYLNQTPPPASSVQPYAIRSLAKFGTGAKSAVPLLLGLLNSPDMSQRVTATNALKSIDPEAAAKAGVR